MFRLRSLPSAVAPVAKNFASMTPLDWTTSSSDDLCPQRRPLRDAGVELTATGIVTDSHRIPYYSREPMAHENRLLIAKVDIIFLFATFFCDFFRARPKQKKTLSKEREFFCEREDSNNGRFPSSGYALRGMTCLFNI